MCSIRKDNHTVILIGKGKCKELLTVTGIGNELMSQFLNSEKLASKKGILKNIEYRNSRHKKWPLLPSWMREST